MDLGLQIADVVIIACCQALCRHIKENPNISENLRKIQRERSDLLALLRTASEELRYPVELVTLHFILTMNGVGAARWPRLCLQWRQKNNSKMHY
jgi:hypothetical protein